MENKMPRTVGIMRTLISLLLMCATCFAWDASSTEITTAIDGPYELITKKKPHVIIGYYDGLEEITQEEYESYTPYNPDTFIAWCMANVMTPELAPHYFAVCDAANKNSEGGWLNLENYGIAMDITETVTIIINEAENQGANV